MLNDKNIIFYEYFFLHFFNFFLNLNNQAELHGNYQPQKNRHAYYLIIMRPKFVATSNAVDKSLQFFANSFAGKTKKYFFAENQNLKKQARFRKPIFASSKKWRKFYR